MAVVAIRTAVQQELVRQFTDGDFYPVTYNPVTKLPVTLLGELVQPSSVLTNEIESGFVESESFRRSLRYERTDWIFEVNVVFDREVALDTFEENWNENPPVIPRSGETNNRQITLVLEEAAYEHPPQQEPTTGTRVRYQVRALLSPT